MSNASIQRQIARSKLLEQRAQAERVTFTAEQLNKRDAKIAGLVHTSNVRNELGNTMRTLKLEGFDSLDFARISKAKLRQMLNDAYRAGYDAAR